MDAQLQRDLNQVINAIRGISTAVSKEAKGELAEAAKPLMIAIKTAAPRGTKPHSRIASNGDRITYKPGNLKRSYRVLRFRRAKLAVFVGVKLGGKIDGYYSSMVRAGSQNVDGSYRQPNDYVERAVAGVGASVLRDSVNRISRIVSKYWISAIFKSNTRVAGGNFNSNFASQYAKIKGR